MAEFEKECVQYYAEKRQLYSRVDGLENEKITPVRKLSGPQYNYDGALVTEKSSDALKKLRSLVEEVRRHAELFRTTVLTYNDRFKADHCKSLAAFLTQLQNATKELVKIFYLGMKKSGDVNFAVVDDMLQA